MKLYIKILAMHFRSAMIYKTSFFLTLIGQFLISFSSFLAVYFMFSRFNKVAGFSYNEVLICFSVILTSYGISDCFSHGLKNFPLAISNGEFDRILLRPSGALFLVFASKIEFTSIGRLFQALLIMFYALPNSQILWTIEKVIVYIFMILGGIAYFIGFYIIYASLCFFTTEGLEFMNLFTDGGREFGKYPLAIYGDSVLKFFTFIIPLATFQYYPLLYILGRPTHQFAQLDPIFTILFLIPCYLLWLIGLRNYKSTGS